MSQQFNTIDVLKLGIEDDPAGLVNLVPNPSGELGGWGWETPVVGSRMFGGVTGAWGSYLRFIDHNTDSASYFLTEPMPVLPGQYAAAYVDSLAGYSLNGTVYFRLSFEWLDSAFGSLGATAQSGYFAEDDGPTYFGESQAPASTAYVKIRADLYSDTAGGLAFGGSHHLTFNDVTVAVADTAAELSGLTFIEPVPYVDILGPSLAIDIEREELNVGTVTAVVRDATLDPAQHSLIRPGKRVQLSVLTGGVWEPIFTAEASTAKVTYDLLHPDEDKRPRITVVATDDITKLAQAKRPDGVADGDYLPWVLEGAGVPWNVNGDGAQVGSAPDVASTNENATAIDQVAITRDTELGHAWLSRKGVLTYASPDQVVAVPPAKGKNLIYGGSFEQVANSLGVYTSGGQVNAPGDAAVGDWYLTGDSSGNIYLDATGGGAIPVSPGLDYTISWYARQDVGASSGYFDLAVYDADGVELGIVGTNEHGIPFTSFGPGGAGGPDIWPMTGMDLSAWERIGISFTAPANAAYVDFYGDFYGDPGAPYQLDAWQFEQSATATAYEDFVVDDLLNESVYNTDLDIDYDTERTINSVTIKLLRFNDGQTEEVVFGPYEDAASVAEWGRRAKEFTVHGIAETDLEAYAAAILIANATPRVRINSVVVPIDEASKLSLATLDLGDLIGVSNTEAGINDAMRVSGVEHSIRPDKWLMKVFFQHDGGVASPQLTPPVNAGEPIGGPVRIGDIVMSGRTDESYGFVKANGQLLNTADYPALFDHYGYTHGGAGAQFAVPDMTDLFPIGAGSKALGTSGGSPTIDLQHSHGAGSLLADSDPVDRHVDSTSGSDNDNYGNHKHNVVGNTASSLSTSVDILNPWRALNFFVKARA